MTSFTLKHEYTFPAPVTVQVPGEGERTFSVFFRLLPKSESDLLVTDDRAFLRAAIKTVSGIDVEEGALPDGKTLLDVLLDLDFVIKGLVDAYFTGREQTLEKN